MLDDDAQTRDGASKPRVLLVEDEPLIRHVICEFLQDGDFTVVACESGEEARQALEDGRAIDAALVDVDLERPGEGYRVARDAREACPDLVVVYTSGGAQTQFAKEKVRDSLFVPKPYAPENLCDLLRDRIELSRSAMPAKAARG